ncbi:MAG: prepilin-type N-terminal cleavage/methylation domain-containing protein, partial [Pedobacter sp.]
RFAFTLAEVLIVVAILGILAAFVIPEYRNYVQKARESAAKENLQILRTAIERYALEHDGTPPGYPNDNTSVKPSYLAFSRALTDIQHYLSEIPENPFNGIKIIQVIEDDKTFPSSPAQTSECGWIYKPSIKEIRLNWTGIDSQRISYFEY